MASPIRRVSALDEKRDDEHDGAAEGPPDVEAGDGGYSACAKRVDDSGENADAPCGGCDLDGGEVHARADFDHAGDVERDGEVA